MRNTNQYKLYTLLTIYFIICTIYITGCGTSQNTTTTTEEPAEVIQLQLDDTTKEELTNLINNGYTTSELFTSEFYFENLDKTPNPTIEQSYTSSNAIYLQINNKYMYRFQLNQEGKVQSYIKYSLEG